MRINRRYSVRYWQIVEWLWKTAVDTVTKNQETVQCVVLSNNGQNVEHSSVHSDTEPRAEQCEVLTDIRRQQWKWRYRINRRYIVRYWRTVKHSSGHRTNRRYTVRYCHTVKQSSGHSERTKRHNSVSYWQWTNCRTQ